MKDILEYILSEIFGKNGWEVEETKNSESIVLKIKPQESIVGKIIGKNGRTIKAIRDILKIKAAKEKKIIHLAIEEIDNPEKER
jgi:predicted RNA-binding protein YlqC (UPF0109 family)